MDTRIKIVSEQRAREISHEQPAMWIAGYFDPMIAEQARRLHEAADPGRLLIVEVTNPQHPLLPQRARAELVAALACVDYVVISDREAARDSDLEITKQFTEYVRRRVNGAGA